MVASKSTPGERGPCIRFEGIKLELSSFSGCQFDFAKDGSLVLTFDSFSGTVMLRSRGDQDNVNHLCSSSSEVGSVGVFDSLDMDMALSQLEQESPNKTEPGTYEGSAIRQACEGKPYPEPSASPKTRVGRPRTLSKLDGNDGGISALVTPASSSKNGNSGQPPQTSPSAGDPEPRPSAAVAPASNASPTRASLPSRTAESRAVSPDFLSSEPESKPRGKRGRRARDDASNSTESFPHQGEAGVQGKAGGRRRASTSQGRPPLRHRPKKQQRRSSKEKKSCSEDLSQSSDQEAPPVLTEVTGEENKCAGREDLPPKTRDVDVDDDLPGSLPTSIPEEPAQCIDENCAGDHPTIAPRPIMDESSRGSPVGKLAGTHPVTSAAAAWIASAATSTPAPGPLSRSAKATPADTKSETRGVGSGGGGCKPMGRWGHTATMISESRMLVLGGQADDEAQQATLGDLYKFDFDTCTWTRPMNCDSTPRAWHTASFIPGKNLLVIFGGERNVDGCPESLDDIMVLDTDIDLWYPPAISGKPPTSRSGHSAAIIGTDLIVFGGVRGRKWQNNVAVLDTEKWHWRHPTIDGSNPAPRSYHSATVVGSLMVVFGGNNQNESFERVYVLDTSKPRWMWFCPEVVGAAPAARTGHSALLLPDGHTILIHGGWDPEDEGGVKNFGDAYLLDTKLWEWSRGPESLLAPVPLAAAAGSPGDGDGSEARDSSDEEDEVALRVGHKALLSRVGRVSGDVEAKEGKGEGWQVAFLGGQDGAGVRRADVAVLSL